MTCTRGKGARRGEGGGGMRYERQNEWRAETGCKCCSMGNPSLYIRLPGRTEPMSERGLMIRSNLLPFSPMLHSTPPISFAFNTQRLFAPHLKPLQFFFFLHHANIKFPCTLFTYMHLTPLLKLLHAICTRTVYHYSPSRTSTVK